MHLQTIMGEFLVETPSAINIQDTIFIIFKPHWTLEAIMKVGLLCQDHDILPSLTEKLIPKFIWALKMPSVHQLKLNGCLVIQWDKDSQHTELW